MADAATNGTAAAAAADPAAAAAAAAATTAAADTVATTAVEAAAAAPLDAAAAGLSVLVTGGAGAGKEGEKEKRATVSVEVCKDLSRGRCNRTDCKFAHPHPLLQPQTVEDGREMVTVCNDALRGKCGRGTLCRYFHPPPHLLAPLGAHVGITPPPTLTQPGAAGGHAGLLAGAAVSGIPDAYLAPFLAGAGALQAQAAFNPAAAAAAAAAAQAAGGFGGMGGVVGSRMFTRPALEVCRDFMNGRCNREASECRFAHTNPTPGEGNMVTVCQDFMKNRCQREACKYFHPSEHLRSRVQDVMVSRGGMSAAVAGPQIPSVAALGGGLGLDPVSAADPISLAAYQAAAYQAYAASFYGGAGADISQPNSKKLRVDESGLASTSTLGGLGADSAAAFAQGVLGAHGAAAAGLQAGGFYSGSQSLTQAYAAAAAAAAAAAGLPHSAAAGVNPYLPAAAAAFPASAGLMGGGGLNVGGSGSGGSGGDRMQVCRDFLNNKCARPNCRYVHPDGTVQVTDNSVTVCRDAMRGRCERSHCRFYHPAGSKADGTAGS